MYLGGESKRSSIENRVSAMKNIETFMITLEDRVTNQEPNYLLKAYMRCWALTNAHLFSTKSTP